MKNPFVPLLLILITGYPLTVAAQSMGLASIAVASFPAFLTCFIGVGLLAIAVADYSRSSPYRARKERKPAPRPMPAAQPAPATWSMDTLSA